MMKPPDLQLPIALKERLAQGHPWIYRTHVPPKIHLPAGTWVRARCGNWSGYGLWDATGPIAVRIFSTRRVPDQHWLRDRLRDAWELRAPLRNSGCTAYRWLFGEGDGVPGITVDLYNDFAVVQTYMDGTATLLDWLLDALRAITPLHGILLRAHNAGDRLYGEDERTRDSVVPESAAELKNKARCVWGIMPAPDLIVQEHEMRFYADLRIGQKTGLFLDQRENRSCIEGLSAGCDVLNCFAYTGSFSLYALRGGARSVISADIGKGLAEATTANIVLNQLDAARHTFMTGDCFELLDRYTQQGQHFDLIILDPPSFAKSKQSRYAALRSYIKLNALAMRCLRPGGLLATASCTSQVSLEMFKEALAAAGASVDRRVQIIYEAGQPRDHPVPAHFPEGRYLKFIVGRVLAQV